MFATAAIMPQRTLPLSAMLALQVFVSAGIAVALVLGKPGWYGAAAGLGGAHAVSCCESEDTRFRAGRPDDWASGTSYAVASGGYNVSSRSIPNCPTARASGSVGTAELLMSLVRIVEDPQAITIMEPAIAVSGETVSLRMLADCLQQFDITVDSIDVISQGARFERPRSDRSRLRHGAGSTTGDRPALGVGGGALGSGTVHRGGT